MVSRLAIAATLLAGVALAAPAAAQTEPGPGGATCLIIYQPPAPTALVPNAYDFVLVNLEGGGQFRVDAVAAGTTIVSPTGENIVSLLKCTEPEVPPTPETTPTPEPTPTPPPEPTPTPVPPQPPVQATPTPTATVPPEPTPTILTPPEPTPTTVVPPASQTGGGGGGQLPNTGTDSAPLIIGGLGLLAAGGVLVGFGRRARQIG